MTGVENRWSSTPANNTLGNIAGTSKSLRNSLLKKNPKELQKFGHSPRNSIKTAVKKKGRNLSKIPVLSSRKNENKFRNGNLVCEPINNESSLISDTTNIEDSAGSDSILKRTRKPNKRKEWNKLPSLITAPSRTKSVNIVKSQDKKNKVMSNKPVAYANTKQFVVAKLKNKKSNSDIRGMRKKNNYCNKYAKDLRDSSITILPKRTLNRKEYLEKVSSGSLLNLKGIISKKFFDFQQKKKSTKLYENIHKDKVISTQIDKELINIQLEKEEEEKLRILAEENIKLLKNVTFRTATRNVNLPKRSLIPIRIDFINKESKEFVESSSINNKKLKTKVSSTEVSKKLSMSTTEVNSFLPKLTKNGNPPISFVEKNIKNVRNLNKLKEKKLEKYKSPSFTIFNRGSTIAFRSLRRTELRRRQTQNRNVFTFSVAQHERYATVADTLYVVLYFLGNVARQIPRIVANMFPSLLKTTTDQATGTTGLFYPREGKQTKLLLRKKKYEVGENYLPPWEEYKYSRQSNGSRGKPHSYLKKDINKLGNLHRFIEELEASFSKDNKKKFNNKEEENKSDSMADFYKRVDMMDVEMRSLPVQVNEKISTSQQCNMNNTSEESIKTKRYRKKKSWKIDYGRLRRKSKSNIGLLKALKTFLFNLYSSTLRSRINSYAIERSHSALDVPCHFTKKHIDTDDCRSTDDTFNVPEFCRLWKPKPKKKAYDKNIIYSFISKSMAKSSTSFVTPVLSSKNSPLIIINGTPNNKKSKKLSQSHPRRKKGKLCLVKTSSIQGSLSDIFYEAEGSGTSVGGETFTLASYGSKTCFFPKLDKTKECNKRCKQCGLVQETKDSRPSTERKSRRGPNTDYLDFRKDTFGNSSKLNEDKVSYIEEYELIECCLEQKKKNSRSSTANKSGRSIASEYADDLIKTADFSCDVHFIECKQYTLGDAFDVETNSYCSCLSENLNERKQTRNKRIKFDDNMSIDELISLMKEEFGDD